MVKNRKMEFTRSSLYIYVYITTLKCQESHLDVMHRRWKDYIVWDYKYRVVLRITLLSFSEFPFHIDTFSAAADIPHFRGSFILVLLEGQVRSLEFVYSNTSSSSLKIICWKFPSYFLCPQCIILCYFTHFDLNEFCQEPWKSFEFLYQILINTDIPHQELFFLGNYHWFSDLGHPDLALWQ